MTYLSNDERSLNRWVCPPSPPPFLLSYSAPWSPICIPDDVNEIWRPKRLAYAVKFFCVASFRFAADVTIIGGLDTASGCRALEYLREVVLEGTRGKGGSSFSCFNLSVKLILNSKWNSVKNISGTVICPSKGEKAHGGWSIWKESQSTTEGSWCSCEWGYNYLTNNC